jgi:hypothetical protein
MEEEMVIMIASTNGMTFFEKYHRLNVYVIRDSGTEVKIKSKWIRHLPYTVDVKLPVENHGLDEPPTSKILFRLRAEILSVENQDEIYMEGSCPFQKICFGRLFTFNVSKLSNKKKTKAATTTAVTTAATTTAATTGKEQVKNMKNKKQKTK